LEQDVEPHGRGCDDHVKDDGDSKCRPTQRGEPRCQKVRAGGQERHCLLSLFASSHRGLLMSLDQPGRGQDLEQRGAHVRVKTPTGRAEVFAALLVASKNRGCVGHTSSRH
jgi:hypothetical protein